MPLNCTICINLLGFRSEINQEANPFFSLPKINGPPTFCNGRDYCRTQESLKNCPKEFNKCLNVAVEVNLYSSN